MTFIVFGPVLMPKVGLIKEYVGVKVEEVEIVLLSELLVSIVDLYGAMWQWRRGWDDLFFVVVDLQV